MQAVPTRNKRFGIPQERTQGNPINPPMVNAAPVMNRGFTSRQKVTLTASVLHIKIAPSAANIYNGDFELFNTPLTAGHSPEKSYNHPPYQIRRTHTCHVLLINC